MWQKAKEWFFKANFLKLSIILAGGLLAIYAIAGTIKTSKWSISEDLDIWKDRAEFIGVVLGPYIAGVGLYYVWKTLKVSINSGLHNHYSSEFSRLDDAFHRFNTKWSTLTAINQDLASFNLEMQMLVVRLNHYQKTMSENEDLKQNRELAVQLRTVDHLLHLFLLRNEFVGTFSDISDSEYLFIENNPDDVLIIGTLLLLNEWVDRYNRFID